MPSKRGHQARGRVARVDRHPQHQQQEADEDDAEQAVTAPMKRRSPRVCSGEQQERDRAGDHARR